MKRAVLALGLVAVVAGTASAAIFVPPPAYEVTLPKLTKPPEVPRRPSAPTAIEARRAPVPVLPVARRTLVPLPATKELGVTADAQSAEAPTVAEMAAKAAIEADGYKNVRVVGQTADGRWTARAMRGTTEISLIVEPDGSVRAD